MLYGSIVIGTCNIFIVLFVLISPEIRATNTSIIRKCRIKFDGKISFKMECVVSNSLPM